MEEVEGKVKKIEEEVEVKVKKIEDKVKGELRKIVGEIFENELRKIKDVYYDAMIPIWKESHKNGYKKNNGEYQLPYMSVLGILQIETYHLKSFCEDLFSTPNNILDSSKFKIKRNKDLLISPGRGAWFPI